MKGGDDMKYPETAKRLSYILNLRKMKPQELANKSGVGKSSISQYLNGNHEPQNTNAGAMAEVLHCNPMWLMGFDVPMEENKIMIKFAEGTLKKDNMVNSAFVQIMDDVSRGLTPEHLEMVRQFAQFLRDQEKPNRVLKGFNPEIFEDDDKKDGE